MNAMQRAERAYGGTTAAPVKSDTQIEYEAFARITRSLKHSNTNRKTQYSEFVSALQNNRALWNILAVDVAGKENSLPQALRAQIFYLAEFTDVHTRLVLSGETDDIAPLTDINLAIMRGLAAEVGAA